MAWGWDVDNESGIRRVRGKKGVAKDRSDPDYREGGKSFEGICSEPL